MKKTGERRVVRSGENIPEGMRKTEAVKLRVRPDVEFLMKARAEALGITVSSYISRLVLAEESASRGVATPPIQHWRD